MVLSETQQRRYSRNVLIPGIGAVGQERLQAARVAVIGLGGLGSPVAFYLAAAGVGTLGLVDAESVDLSNLQRQILHTTEHVGALKTVSAAERLTALNPDLHVELLDQCITAQNAEKLVANYDVIVEATDNFETKFLLNDTCLNNNKPLVTAGILALSGHALFVAPGQSPCLRCLVPEIPTGEPTTFDVGVLGAVAGVVGCTQALEVIRWLTGLWQPQDDGSGILHSVDGVGMRLHTLRISRRSDCFCAPFWKVL